MGSRDVSQASLLRRLDGGILRLTLNRPDRGNALEFGLRQALEDEFERAATEQQIRAVILLGAGGAFCAGGDLKGFGELRDARTYRHRSHDLTRLFDSIERLEKPVVAGLDGAATGAGLALALSCDWRVGSPRARILFREASLGLIPSHGGLTRLVRLLGLGRAKQVLLGGEELDAEAALSLGILSEAARSSEELDLTCEHRAEAMLTRPPLSFGAAKRLLHLAAESDSASAISAEGLAQTFLLQSADHREAMQARREGRQPAFRGA